jgi:thiol-disulfide isomerase/thioredoxin
MFLDREKIHAPEIEGAPWFNSPPLSMKALRGKIVLVDFWDYTCVNCIRTLPYLKAWHERYQSKGLVVIGVHAPEFSFAKEEARVGKAIERFGLPYPVALDNDYRTWQAFANRYWPAKYLIDRSGVIRYRHLGEGNTVETELAIQSLLMEIDPSIALPDPMRPIRESDYPGAVCIPPTPELYLGAERGRIGNSEDLQEGKPVDYPLPDDRKEDIFYAEGRWKAEKERLVFAGPRGGAIHLKYSAKEVNLVMAAEKEATVWINQDSRVMRKDEIGKDVTIDEKGRAFVRVTEPRMYHLIDNPGFERRELRLFTQSKGLSLYAFTFVSCKASPQ